MISSHSSALMKETWVRIHYTTFTALSSWQAIYEYIVIIYRYNKHEVHFSSHSKHYMSWYKTLKTSLRDTFWESNNQPRSMKMYPLMAWMIGPADLQYNHSQHSCCYLHVTGEQRLYFPSECPKPQKCNTWSRRMECWEFISFSNSTLVEFRSIPGIFGLVLKCSSIL